MKKEGFMKTTGKVYNNEKIVECSSCGKIYDRAREEICPKCGSLHTKCFQRTVSSVAEEEKEKSKS